MIDVIKLVQIISKLSSQNIPLLYLNQKQESTTRDLVFYKKIIEGEIKDDESAAKIIYDCKPTDRKYAVLKSRLKNKLLNHLFFIDFRDNKHKVSNRYDKECQELLFKASILRKSGEHFISEKILHKSLTLSKKLEFTNYSINALEQLRFLYFNQKNNKNFYNVKKDLQHYKLLKIHEEEAEDLYFTAKIELTKSVEAKNKYMPELKKVLQRLELLWKETESFNVYDFYYKLNLFYQELSGDYNANLKLTEETNILFSQGKLNPQRFDLRYNHYTRVYAFLMVRDYKRGLEYAAEYLQSFDRSSNNWFLYMEAYFLLAIGHKDYNLASRLLNQTEMNPFNLKIPSRAKERWNLYRGYLAFLLPEQLKSSRSFNYQQLLSSVPSYSKDKYGFNLAILALQYLYHLKNHDKMALLYVAENMKKYFSRYLKEGFSERGKYFFKLLMLTVTNDFNLQACIKKGSKIIEKLKETPPPGDAYAEIEIIPYEHLWNIIINMIEDRGLYKKVI